MSQPATKTAPYFVSVRALAALFGLCEQTIRGYIKRGVLQAVQLQVGPRPGIDPPRRTDRARWLIPIDSARALLERLYRGERLPPALMRRLWRRGERPRSWPRYNGTTPDRQ